MGGGSIFTALTTTAVAIVIAVAPSPPPSPPTPWQGTWHAECFECRHCSKPLAKGDRFYSHVGSGNSLPLGAGGRVTCCDEDVDVDADGPMVRCHRCHVELTCPRCFSCTNHINGEEAVSAGGNTFHLRCFNCSSSGKALEQREADGKSVVRYFEHEGGLRDEGRRCPMRSGRPPDLIAASPFPQQAKCTARRSSNGCGHPK